MRYESQASHTHRTWRQAFERKINPRIFNPRFLYFYVLVSLYISIYEYDKTRIIYPLIYLTFRRLPLHPGQSATDDDGNPVVDGVLANYFVAPSAAGPPTPEREGADPDPGRAERIVHALDTCLETISESVTDMDSDERETTTEVTVFLCSPPVDLRYCAEEVDRINHLLL